MNLSSAIPYPIHSSSQASMRHHPSSTAYLGCWIPIPELFATAFLSIHHVGAKINRSRTDSYTKQSTCCDLREYLSSSPRARRLTRANYLAP